MSRNTREQGVSLLEVLIALAILSIAMGGFFAQIRSHTQTAINIQERLVAQAWLNHYLLGVQLGEENYAHKGQIVRDDRQRYSWYLQPHVEDIQHVPLKRLTLSLYRFDEIVMPVSESALADTQLISRLSGVVDDAEK